MLRLQPTLTLRPSTLPGNRWRQKRRQPAALITWEHHGPKGSRGIQAFWLSTAVAAASRRLSRRHSYPKTSVPQKQNLLYDDGPSSAVSTFFNLRDLACAAFLAHGCFLAFNTVTGNFVGYTDVIRTSVCLGAVSCAAGLLQAVTDSTVEDDRPGMARERWIILLSAAWLLSVVWLCLRLGGIFDYPPNLVTLDPLLSSLCCGTFILMAVAPWVTRSMYFAELTELERTRMQGLTACGAVGVVYCLDALAFAIKGPEWWQLVTATWPMQSTCEESTLIFGALALDACMLLHRLGREGLVRFRSAVPLGVASSLGLAIVPTVAQVAWNFDAISLFDFYFI